jgi:YD repeat-containing protein
VVRTLHYDYDAAGRLTNALADGYTVGRWLYDANGNRMRFETPGYGVDAEYDDQDRLTQYGDTLFAYTAAGEE